MLHTNDAGANPARPAPALTAANQSGDTHEQPVINPNRSLLAKRMLDLSASSVGLVLLSPIFVVIAIAIKREDGGPVFFRQERVGQHGKPFRIWKFRTMVPDAERRGTLLTVAGDNRITRVGRYLRRTKLDELPQLINVLLGEMSLVGPRPEVTRFAKQYTSEQRQVLSLKPGITDPASLKFINEEEMLSSCLDPAEEYIGKIMPYKIQINTNYAGKANLATDLSMIMTTVFELLKRKNS